MLPASIRISFSRRVLISLLYPALGLMLFYGPCFAMPTLQQPICFPSHFGGVPRHMPPHWGSPPNKWRLKALGEAVVTNAMFRWIVRSAENSLKQYRLNFSPFLDRYFSRFFVLLGFRSVSRVPRLILMAVFLLLHCSQYISQCWSSDVSK